VPHLRHFHYGGRPRSLCGDGQKSRCREKAFEAAGVQIIGRLLPIFNPERHRGTHCSSRVAEAFAKSSVALHRSRTARELIKRKGMMNSEEFKASLVHGEPPNGLTAPLMALWWDAKGNWTRAPRLARVKDPLKAGKFWKASSSKPLREFRLLCLDNPSSHVRLHAGHTLVDSF
jgi:hypothetical protein